MRKFSFNEIMGRFNIRLKDDTLLKEQQKEYFADMRDIAKTGAQIMRNEIVILNQEKRIERLERVVKELKKPNIIVDIPNKPEIKLSLTQFNKHRRNLYWQRRKKGLCVVCGKKAVKSLAMCNKHRKNHANYQSIYKYNKKKTKKYNLLIK